MGDTGSDDIAPEWFGESSSGWSGWSFDWRGLLAVVVIGGAVVVGWRWLDTSAADSSADEVVSQRGPIASSVPPTTGDETPTSLARVPVVATTQPTRSTLPNSTTSTVATEERVVIRGEMKPCRFGDNCLVASFSIDGFDPHPGRFACVYPNSRTELRFGSNRVDDACVTADAGDTIVIEVGGVRSSAISEQALDGG